MRTSLRHEGFSLVEFLIAMTIGLFMVAGLVYLIAESSRSRAEMERSSRQVENGRYALERLAEDLRHAGFYAEFFSVPAPTEAGFPATLAAADPCLATVAGVTAGMPLAVQAYDGGASSPLTCIDDDDYRPNTDVLVVRRASTTSVPKSGPLADHQIYIQTNPLEFRIDEGVNVATFTLKLPSANNTAEVDAPLRRFVTRIYYVARCNVPASGATCNGVSDDGGTPIPTLRMIELGADASGPVLQTFGIAEGIEHLQFDFGLDTDGDGVADNFVMCDSGSPCTTTQWSNLVAARVHVVARNTETSPGHADSKTYSLGLKGYTAAAGDPYRRHAYTSLVRVSNISMRREQ